MTVQGLSGRLDQIIAWADRLQRRHGVLGFPCAAALGTALVAFAVLLPRGPRFPARTR